MKETMNGKTLLKQTRVEYIDLFRAFGIILMVMGHIKYGSAFDKWIHAFHMPMFFFVSGWFYKSNDLIPTGKILLRKAKSLLLPYLYFEIIVWFLCMIIIPEYRSVTALYYMFFENTYAIPIEINNGIVSPIPGAMWFLTALFFCEIFYIMLDKTLGCTWKQHMSIIILVIFGMIAPKFLPFRLPWALDAAFVGIGFFHVARIVKGTKAERLLDLKLWQSLVLGVVISISIMIFPNINMRTGSYGWYLPFWINALGSIVVGWNLVKCIEQGLQHSVLLKKISQWLKGIGKNSIAYLCLNQIVILSLMILMNMIGITGLLSKILILILTMAMLFGLEKLICNTRLKVLIGRF